MRTDGHLRGWHTRGHAHDRGDTLGNLPDTTTERQAMKTHTEEATYAIILTYKNGATSALVDFDTAGQAREVAYHWVKEAPLGLVKVEVVREDTLEKFYSVEVAI